jgi:long-chain-fatty-acyl-CoA reductase
MAMPNVHIPLVVNGRRIDNLPRQRDITVERGSLRTPCLDEESVTDILSHQLDAVAKLPLHEIISFLYNVGQNWKAADYPRRRLYIRDCVKWLGCSERVAELDANWLAMTLCSQAAIYDIVRAELGSHHILDMWIPQEECEVKAFPRGRSFHSLSGNIPLAGVASILRALVTKNQVIVKSSSSDPFTPLALALSFQDIDASHPVARSVSVVSWQAGQENEIEQRLILGADVICAWGGQSAMEWAAKYSTNTREVIFFGPKRSISIIDCAGTAYEAASRAVAHDVSFHDQQACHSVQSVFVLNDTSGRFSEHLSKALDLYARLLPPPARTLDEKANSTLLRLDALLSRNKSWISPNGSWLVIESEPSTSIQNPLNRTVFVHPISELEDISPHLDSEIQTVALLPWELSYTLRDSLAAAGVSRVVEAGMTNIFRPGTAHDSIYPLQRLVRFVSCEFPHDYRFKSTNVKVDQTLFLEENKFLEFVP